LYAVDVMERFQTSRRGVIHDRGTRSCVRSVRVCGCETSGKDQEVKRFYGVILSKARYSASFRQRILGHSEGRIPK
jgi:hypothetical protein